MPEEPSLKSIATSLRQLADQIEGHIGGGPIQQRGHGEDNPPGGGARKPEGHGPDNPGGGGARKPEGHGPDNPGGGG